jgi:hypothetical protein
LANIKPAFWLTYNLAGIPVTLMIGRANTEVAATLYVAVA